MQLRNSLCGGGNWLGLKIALNNRHRAHRTFFSDNWPDKARHWLPVLDHPYDKATCEIVVTAPANYQVVANGLLQEEPTCATGRRRTHWSQSVPIAPWLYVLGVAPFAVQRSAPGTSRRLQTWVYAQDRDAGYPRLEGPAREALAFYADRVGPFPYEKLASVPGQQGSAAAWRRAASIFYSEGR